MLQLLSSFFQSQNQKKHIYYLSLLKNDNQVHGYTIHGLWPDYGDGTYPQYCKKVIFDINKLKPIEKELLDYWELPEDHDKLEISFWKHEYEKHGSCVFQEMDELTYFKTAIQLYQYVVNNGIDIAKYKKGKNYMIPFDTNFKLIN